MGTREPFIVINASSRPSRQRFTAAHELAHHEMHRFETDHLLLADQDIFASHDDKEVEANAFAAYFLAPDEGIRQRVGGDTGESISQDMVVELMGVFGLSYDAMAYRLLNAGLINRPERDALMENPMARSGCGAPVSMKRATRIRHTYHGPILRRRFGSTKIT